MPHRYSTHPVSVTITENGAVQTGTLENVSTRGVGVRDVGLTAGTHATLQIPLDHRRTITRDVQCVWDTPATQGQLKRCGLSCNSAFSLDELRSLLLPPPLAQDGSHSIIDLMKEDFRAVSTEVLSIQTCRTTIFCATLAAVAGVYLAARGVLFGTDNGSPVVKPNWIELTWMTGAVFFLFVVGAYATMEKARALNNRKGFLAALSLCLQGKLQLSRYLGWSRLRTCGENCDERKRQPGACSMQHTRDKCRNIAQREAAGLNATKPLRPSLLQSFTCLISYLYTWLYLLTASSLALCLTMIVWTMLPVNSKLPWSLSEPQYKGVAVALFWLGILSSFVLFRFGRKVVAYTVVAFLSFVVLIALPGVQFTDEAVAWGAWIFFVVMGAALGVIGCTMLSQLLYLRQGKYSFETSTYAWQEMLSRCPGIPISGTDVTVAPTPKGPWQRISLWSRTLIYWLMHTPPPQESRNNGVPQREPSNEESE